MYQNITHIIMEKDVNMLLATYGKYFPESSLLQIREIFEKMDERQIGMLACLQFKDPITALILSLLGGYFGIDRLYLGHSVLGIIKLLTCGGLMLWMLIDLFLVMDAARQENLQKLMRIV